jgi:hypothetical protein
MYTSAEGGNKFMFKTKSLRWTEIVRVGTLGYFLIHFNSNCKPIPIFVEKYKQIIVLLRYTKVCYNEHMVINKIAGTAKMLKTLF